MGEQTVTAAEVLHDSKSELQELGVSAEQATEACRKIGEAWASVDNRPLYNRYRHTKKKRIRKKYAKRILEWYRTEVAPC